MPSKTPSMLRNRPTGRGLDALKVGGCQPALCFSPIRDSLEDRDLFLYGMFLAPVPGGGLAGVAEFFCLGRHLVEIFECPVEGESDSKLAGKWRLINRRWYGIGRAPRSCSPAKEGKVAIAEIDARHREETAHPLLSRAIAIRADVTDPDSLQRDPTRPIDNFGPARCASINAGGSTARTTGGPRATR